MELPKKLYEDIKRGLSLGGFDPELAGKFVNRVRKIGKNLGYSDPDAFTVQALNLMKLESGFNPKIVNTLGYKGLIQFSPNNARVFGYTEDPIKQLDAVEGYLKSNKRAMEQTHGKPIMDRDRDEHGSILLTSVLTGPASRSLRNPSEASVSDKYGTSNAKYYQNIRAGLQHLSNKQSINPNLTKVPISTKDSTIDENLINDTLSKGLDSSSTLQDQSTTFNHNLINQKQKPQMPDLNMDVIAGVVDLMKKQKNTMDSNQEFNNQNMDALKKSQEQNRLLLEQQRLAKEKELKDKATKIQNEKAASMQASFTPKHSTVQLNPVKYTAPKVDTNSLSQIMSQEAPTIKRGQLY